MSTAIIQGATGGLGLPLLRLLHQRTQLNLIALTSRSIDTTTTPTTSSSSSTSFQPPPDLQNSSRILWIPSINTLDEPSIQRMADQVGDRLGGKKDLRLVVGLAGSLNPEKSLSQFDPTQALETFHLNSIGHLVLYKHLQRFIPTLREYEKIRAGGFSSGQGEQEDPANGWVRPEGSVCLSTSARVGSIADNRMGGWYSYRASKAALNQMIRTLDHELVNKKSSALALAYHPGTTLTSFTAPIIGHPDPNPSKGLFTPEQGAEKLLEMIRRAGRAGDGPRTNGTGGSEAGAGAGAGGEGVEYGGGFWDWKGEKVGW